MVSGRLTAMRSHTDSYEAWRSKVDANQLRKVALKLMAAIRHGMDSKNKIENQTRFEIKEP